MNNDPLSSPELSGNLKLTESPWLLTTINMVASRPRWRPAIEQHAKTAHVAIALLLVLHMRRIPLIQVRSLTPKFLEVFAI
jgi:hypothetical protein